MHDTATYLLLSQADRSERIRHAEGRTRASRVARLRRLDRRAAQAASRARLVRLALG